MLDTDNMCTDRGSTALELLGTSTVYFRFSLIIVIHLLFIEETLKAGEMEIFVNRLKFKLRINDRKQNELRCRNSLKTVVLGTYTHPKSHSC